MSALKVVVAATVFSTLAPSLVATAPRSAFAGGASCAELGVLPLAGGHIDFAQTVNAGAFLPPGANGRTDAFARLPMFCRVAATLRPSSDSDIKVEVWLPINAWNNKLQAVGNGGWAGTIPYPSMATALAQGYATVGTDTGHSTVGASFALNHPEKFIDYSYRSEHEMTVAAKAIIDRFYGTAPRFSYFNGCSTGGRQAIVEASRYPNDFDGIIAGAAANPKAHLDAWRIWNAQAMLETVDSFIPPEKYGVIHQAVVAKCDALDGAKDGLIEDPTTCQFDPGTLQCKTNDEKACLSAAQVKAARTIMSPAKNRKTGEIIFPTYAPGSELGWSRLLGGAAPYDTAVDQFKYVVFSDPNWDWRTFDLERDTAKADAAGNGVLASVNPDLSAFAQRGGKLLTYHGYSDPSIAPQASINFYKKAVAATRSPGSADWIRLFMVPGMGHCTGGEGPDTFDMVSALEDWVERGRAPVQVQASKIVDGRVTRSRPLCPYPQVAKYRGSGSVDDAANFACIARAQ